MTLRLRFWGTRGSIPSPGPNTVRYGGNTPCVEVRTATDWLVILDAGTGIRELGRTLVASSNGHGIAADIFLTHAHWDHIQGIPFFAPIFLPGNHFTIWGSKTLETSIDRVIRDQMLPVVFPVTFEQLDATIDFGAGFNIFHHQNQAITIGYRYQHLSNANISLHNPGTDANTFYVGVSRFRTRGDQRTQRELR